MMKILFSVLAAASALFGAAPEGIVPNGWKQSCSVLDTFPDPADRDQGNVGACHAFASIGLLESALYRQYGRKLRLSEGDLFIQYTVNGPRFFPGMLERVLGGYRFTEDDLSGRFEGGNLREDLVFALNSGVATGRTADYEDMALHEPSTYLAYRGKLLAALNELSAEVRRKRNKWIKECLEGGAGNVKPECVVAAFNEKMYFKLLAFKMRESTQKQREADILAPGDLKLLKLIGKEREAVRVLFQAGFKIASHREAKTAGKKPDSPQGRLRQAGQAAAASDPDLRLLRRAEWILRQLDHLRPVGIVMDVAQELGLKKPASHIFVLDGYKTGPDGGLTFLVRNSWGPANAAVLGSIPLDRIANATELITVVAPRDKDGHCRD